MSIQVAESVEASMTRFTFNEILMSSAVYQRAAAYALTAPLDRGGQSSSSSFVQAQVQHAADSPEDSTMSVVMRGTSTPSRNPIRDHFRVPRNLRLYGREDILEAAREALRPQEVSIGISICTVYGMPGVGKTCIALEYLYRYAEKSAVYNIAWRIEARSPTSIALSYSSIVSRLGLTTSREPSVHVAFVRECLQRMGKTITLPPILLQLLTNPNRATLAARV